MAKLIYSALTSLDGYVADETATSIGQSLMRKSTPSLTAARQIGTYLFGRKRYETMAVWETPDVIPYRTAAVLELAPIWQAADKIVYSTTLQTVSMANTRLERKFEADAVRELKAGATRHDGFSRTSVPCSRPGK